MSINREMTKEDVEYYSDIGILQWNITRALKTMKQCHLHQHGWTQRVSYWLSKSDREADILYGIPYMWCIKRNDTNELTYKTDLLT